MLANDVSVKLQIFATDIDDSALAAARIGSYAEAAVHDLPPERLERFFLRDNDGYLIIKEIRELCIFSVHNLIKAAPFSKLDLISCRNLLIHRDDTVQNRVLPLFHFSLPPHRLL